MRKSWRGEAEWGEELVEKKKGSNANRIFIGKTTGKDANQFVLVRWSGRKQRKLKAEDGGKGGVVNTDKKRLSEPS